MKIYLTSFFLLLFILNVFGQASLSGKVTDADTGEPILFGDVVVYRNGALVTGEQTDFDGNYVISPLKPGRYSVVFKYVGYTDVEIEKIVVKKNKETNLNAEMSSETAYCIRSCGVPLVVQSYSTDGISLTAKDIANLPYKDINGIITQAYGCSRSKKKQLELKSMYDEKPGDDLEALVVKIKKKPTVKIKTKNHVENTQLNVKVFPNPVSDILEISLPKPDMTAKLFNLSGQLVLTLIRGESQLDVSALLAGNYYLEITNGKMVQTEKIVVIRD